MIKCPMKMEDMRRFLARNKRLLAVTALLMAGSGCVGAVRETNRQLIDGAMKPVTVPVEAYGTAVETASGVQANQEERMRQADFEE